jgi:hypothetical protein
MLQVGATGIEEEEDDDDDDDAEWRAILCIFLITKTVHISRSGLTTIIHMLPKCAWVKSFFIPINP